jgi:putative endonuclease
VSGGGHDAEVRAARHLEQLGWKILHRNYRALRGELDLVAVDERGVLCFVEVRARASDRFGRPEETIDARKRASLVRAAETYRARERVGDRPCRFDVVAIDPAGVRLIKDAI